MTPAARIDAAIGILDSILAGQPAEAALLRWSRASRFAGSGDRAGVRDLVFDSLRRQRSRAALGGALSGRGLMIGMCHEQGVDPAGIFTGEGHAPAPLSPAEVGAGRAPQGAEALDLPDWIVPHWRRALGEDADAVARAMRERAPVWLRVNLLRSDPARAIAALAQEGIATVPHGALATALCVTDGARRIAASRSYRDGLIELQDLSPQLACDAVPVQDKVLDFCAGGGGKALALAAQGARHVTAHDRDIARMGDLPARAARAGARIQISGVQGVTGRFDTVVADVPCSGSGTWRRVPDAKWRLTPQMVQDLLAVQREILDRAARFVAPGGYFAYMTCSVLEQENGDQVAAFLGRNAQFSAVLQRHYSPINASDGFFLALMRRH